MDNNNTNESMIDKKEKEFEKIFDERYEQLSRAIIYLRNCDRLTKNRYLTVRRNILTMRNELEKLIKICYNFNEFSNIVSNANKKKMVKRMGRGDIDGAKQNASVIVAALEDNIKYKYKIDKLMVLIRMCDNALKIASEQYEGIYTPINMDPFDNDISASIK